MRILELIAGTHGGEREEISIDVPANGDRDVVLSISSTTNKMIEDGVSGKRGRLVSDEKSIRIPRPVWDNLIAALATQKGKR